MGGLPSWLVELVNKGVIEGEGDRSGHCFHVMLALMEHGLTDDEVRLVADGAPFAAKYAERGDLDAEIARTRAKWIGDGSKRARKSGHADPGSNGASKKRSRDDRKTQAQTLIDIVTEDGVELFHTPDGKEFADVPVDGHRETWSLSSRGFRRWLKRKFYERTEGAPNSDAMSTAIGVIEAMAHHDGPEREVQLRIAHCGCRIYLDLCDPAWRAIEIREDGWSIVDKPPVRFRRTRGMLQIPDPVAGGEIKELGGFAVTFTSMTIHLSW